MRNMENIPYPHILIYCMTTIILPYSGWMKMKDGIKRKKKALLMMKLKH